MLIQYLKTEIKIKNNHIKLETLQVQQTKNCRCVRKHAVQNS